MSRINKFEVFSPDLEEYPKNIKNNEIWEPLDFKCIKFVGQSQQREQGHTNYTLWHYLVTLCKGHMYLK